MSICLENNSVIRRIATGKTAVCGIGISNLPLIDFLLRLGADITARDKKSRDELGEDAEILEKRGVKLKLGEGYLNGLDEDVIFRTPGMRPDKPEIASAEKRGAIITSEMELFMELTPAMVIGVTGSDGKTTTTTLTYKMLEAESARTGKGRVWVGGNIGAPLLPHVCVMSNDDFAVLELSSFQLYTMKRSPLCSAITNITPNHLDWHTGMEEYITAKMNICTHPGAKKLTVNAENRTTYEIGCNSPLEVTFFSSVKKSYNEIVPSGKHARAVFERDGIIIMSDGKTEEKMLSTSDILLPGRHNVENYMTAISNVYGIVSTDVLTDIAKSFRGVEHRLEFVRELDGVKYYNGSIDSSPTRTAAALSALNVKPVVICGGYDKKIPFAPLADALCAGAEAVVLTGATAGKIKDALYECQLFNPEKLTVVTEPDFELAILRARSLAKRDGIVLLSPACASFDRFKNFMERGNLFKEIVNNFKSEDK